MKKHLSRLLLLIVAPGFSPSHARSAEPLPPRALAQIGDHRFYHGPGITCAVLSPDGKYIASAAHDLTIEEERDSYNRTIIVWDAATGERLRKLRVPHEEILLLAFSPHGKRLAADYRISGRQTGVAVFDVETGKLLWRREDFKSELRYLQFSTDGKRVQLNQENARISAWDVDTGKRLKIWNPPLKMSPKMDEEEVKAYMGLLSPDGKTVAWAMYYSKGMVIRRNVIDLRVQDADTDKLLYQKKFDLLGRWDSIAFSADGKRFGVDCDEGIVIWYTADGKKTATFDISIPHTFSLGSDGRHALIFEEGIRLRLWNLHTGNPSLELDPGFLDWSQPVLQSPTFSVVGKTLLYATHSTLRLFDTTTGKERGTPCHRDAVTPRFSADGRMLFTSCDLERCCWDVAKKCPLLFKDERRKKWEIDARAYGDGDRLFLDLSQGNARIRETATGRILHTLDKPANWGRYSPITSRLLLYGEPWDPNPDFLWLFDTKTGKLLTELRAVNLGGPAVFSPNGVLFARPDPYCNLHIHDATTGKLLRTLRSTRLPEEDKIHNNHLLFSPDSEYLIQARFPLPMRVAHVSSGRVISRFYANPEKKNKNYWFSCMACSPDNRLLAAAEYGSGIIRLLEIASGKVRAEFAGHRHGVHGLDFSPDGKTLASGGKDNVVYLWDVTGAKTPPVKEANPAACWNDLASDDGKRAGEAIASFLRKPEASVAFLKEKLHPAKSVDEKRLRQWIADLDADAFETRETASRELIRLGERVEDALRRELKNRPTLEVRRRIENVLSKLEPSPLPPEMLRILRAIEVLEHIGTPTARRCLESLAKGAAEARRTREAKAALGRLEKRREYPMH